MRYLFYLLPLFYAADWLWRELTQPSGFLDLWEIDALALLLLSLPGILQLIYEAMPYRTPRAGKRWLPKMKVQIPAVPCDTEKLTADSKFKVLRIDGEGMTLRCGSWWSGEWVRLENRPDGNAELRHRYLNVCLLGRGQLSEPAEQLLQRLLLQQPQPINLESQITTQFGIVIPPDLILDYALQPLDERGLLLGSATVAETEPALIPEQLQALLPQRPDQYGFYGFWGYGANSYAFYYVDINDNHTLWLRLPYGGLYGDTDQQATRINALLESLAHWLVRAPKLQLIQNMGEGTLILAPGEPTIPWHYPEVTDLGVLLNDTPRHDA